MIEALDGIEEGVLVGGVLLKDIKFVDDQAMMMMVIYDVVMFCQIWSFLPRDVVIASVKTW